MTTRKMLPGATGLVLSNLANCTTLFEAMKEVANVYNLLHGGAYNRVELRQDCLAYIIDDSHFPYAVSTDSAQVRVTMECVLIFLHGMLTLIAGHELHGLLRKVHTKGSRLTARRTHMDFWPAPIGWQSRHYALFYDLSAMSLPLARGNLAPSSQAIYRNVIDLIERTQGGATRRRSLPERLHQAFDRNIYDQDAVARFLGLSVATLRRRLRESGQPGFRELRDGAMNEAAKSLLAQHWHPSKIADQLGFCDLRSFNRAFTRWNGMTPTVYARTMQSGTLQSRDKTGDAR
jgi:AraC-like DNA-binding protein